MNETHLQRYKIRNRTNFENRHLVFSITIMKKKVATFCPYSKHIVKPVN